MKGLAFAVSLFHRLSAEAPSKPVEAVVSDVEAFAKRLIEAGKSVEAAFADASAELAAVVEPKGDTAKTAAVAVFPASPKPADPVSAIVGGAVTPAPTPVAPGMGGVPSGKV